MLCLTSREERASITDTHSHSLLVSPPKRECCRSNYAHASVDEVLPWVDDLKPEQVWLVGAGCGWGDHDEANAELARRGYPQVQLAHDGLFLEGFRL